MWHLTELPKRQLTRINSIAIVGAPPFARGTDLPGRDLELQLVKAFPKCALFVEKPVSSGPEDPCWRVAEKFAASRTLVGVGYMLRYLKGMLFQDAARSAGSPPEHE